MVVRYTYIWEMLTFQKMSIDILVHMNMEYKLFHMPKLLEKCSPVICLASRFFFKSNDMLLILSILFLLGKQAEYRRFFL